MKRIRIAGMIVMISMSAGCERETTTRPPAPPVEAASRRSPPPLLEAFDQTIPGATARLHMVPIPAMPDGRRFFIAATETPWEIYDVFALRLDDSVVPDADAITRPSTPYLPPDRGWGHEGYPAMSITFDAACRFCEWLTKRTGRKYRIPFAHEWEHAARAGGATAWFFGDSEAALPDHAWFDANSDGRTHPVGLKTPNAWGLFDVHGNVAEWAFTADLAATACGGSYRDDAAATHANARKKPRPEWQMSDPQMPKSPWWLTDGPFVGFRVVTDAPSHR